MVTELPVIVAKQPKIVIDKYLEAKAIAGGGLIGELVATEWLNNKLCTACERPVQTKTLKFEVVADGQQLVKKSESGDDYVDFVLSDNLPDSEGLIISESLLNEWANDINSGKVIVGDIDHEEYDYVVSNIPDPEEAASIIKRMKKGIAKGVKAFVKAGKLFVRAIIDKRYKKVIEKAKGVSLEALLNYDTTPSGEKVAVSGDLLGFTFAVSGSPVNPRATIIG